MAPRASAGGAGAQLLDADELRQLERLSIAHRDAVFAGLTGQRAGALQARGLEFADYRPYTPGDELRRVDWNVYARLGEAFVKTAPGEIHTGLAILLDGSRSMDAATGTSSSKFRYAQRLAAMLGALALLRFDVAETHLLADGESWPGGRLSAPQSVVPLVDGLARARRGVRTDLLASVRAYRRGRSAADAVVLITDALVDLDDLRAALAELARSAPSAAFVHTIDARERMPRLRGAIELRDRETGERMLVEVTPQLDEEYASRFDRLADEARELAEDAGVAYLRADLSRPPLDLLFDAARQSQLLSL